MATGTRQSLNRVLRPLASLRLAVVVLGVLAAVLAGATIYESRYGSQAVQRDVYQAVWFDLLLVLLGVNVAAAAIIRWPWRLRQTGFVITHVGILVILGGCLTTRWMGVTGRVILAEGKQDSHIVQDDWVVEAAAHDGGEHAQAQIAIAQPPKAGAVSDFEVGGKPYEMKILNYYPNAELRTQLVEAGGDLPAAALVELKMPEASMHAGAAADRSMTQWLAVDDRGEWSIRTPGFTLLAASQYTPPRAPTSQPGKGTIVVSVDGHEYEADVEQALAGPVMLGDGKTSVLVKGYYERAVVGPGGLADDPQRPVNPAVVLELTRDGKPDKRIVFARFGDISAMHGGGANNPVKVSLRHSMADSGGLKVVLVPRQAQNAVSTGAPEWTLYEENGSQTVQQAVLRPDAPVTLKGNGLIVGLRQSLAHAQAKQVVVQEAGKNGEDERPAMEVEVAGPGGPQREWLSWGQPATISGKDGPMQLTLQARQAHLPFALRLDKFEIETYPGTDMPAMYRSRVKVIDEGKGLEQKATIEMNRPLEYDGWSFFQSSYSLNGGERTSILSASKDPGKPVVYGGAFLLILGTVILAVQRLKAQVPVNGKKAMPAVAELTETAVGTSSERKRDMQ